MNSIAKALMMLVAVSLIASITATFMLGDFYIKQAQADKIRSDTEWENTLRQMEAPFIQAQREAQIKAEMDKLNADAQAHIEHLQDEVHFQSEQHTQRLESEKNFAQAGSSILVGLGLVVCLALALAALVTAGWAWQRFVRREELWADRAFRLQMRESARAREQQIRMQARGQKPIIIEFPISSNGHRPPTKPEPVSEN